MGIWDLAKWFRYIPGKIRDLSVWDVIWDLPITDASKGKTVIYTVSQKVPTFNLSVTLSDLSRFSKFLHCWKAYEICYKTHTALPPHLRYVVTLPWEIENSNFCWYSADMEENANRDTDEYPSPLISHGQFCTWVCGLSSRLKTKSLTVSTFSSVRELRSVPLPVNCACVPQLFQQLIMVALCNRADHYIFILFLLSSSSFFFSSPNLSSRRLNVYHTLAHGVALVRI